MIVIDASAALSGLLNARSARDALAGERLHAPHLIDSELASGLRRMVGHRQLEPDAAWAALDTWRRLGITRYPGVPLLERVWQLRSNFSAYDSTYIALAETLDCGLLTADARIAHAPGPRCPITVVPR